MLNGLVVFIVFCFFPCLVFAVESASSVSIEQAAFGLDYLPVQMPNDQANLGLFGMHLDKSFDPGWYVGGGLYSAVSGNYSGFFALGLEAGWKHELYRALGVDLGIYAGSGGGSGLANQIGDGTFYLPHMGLYYRFPYLDLGLNYSYIRFQTGQVSSQQIQLTVRLPFSLYIQPKPFHSQGIPSSVSRNYIAAVAAVYDPFDSQFLDGTPLTNRTQLLGVEFGHYFNEHWFQYVEFTGAIQGNYNGYANVFLGLGRESFISGTSFFYAPRFALGSGGGGRYDVGSGLLYYPSFALGWQFHPSWQLLCVPAYLSSASGHYQAYSMELQLRYLMGLLGPGECYRRSSEWKPESWRMRVGNQTYFHPEHDNAMPNENINLLALKIDKFLDDRWYLSGQTAFAYSGNAAGYFSGLLGGGYQYPVLKRLDVYGEVLLGTAGGAGLAIQDGAIFQYGAGLHYHLLESAGVYLQLSQSVAFSGGFNPVTLDAGLSYRFDFLSL